MQRCSHCGHYGRRNGHCPRSRTKKSRRSQQTRKNESGRNKGPYLPTECYIPIGTPRYSYSPFSDTDSIRLLVLLPGWNWEPVRCELIVDPLHTARSYEAISYAWGREQDRGDILCHNRRLRVPWSLEHGLRKFRRLRKKRILWADSICINQDDKTERGHQVQNMGKIYEQARMVLVWLGFDKRLNASSLFQFIRELGPLPPPQGRSAIDVDYQIREKGTKYWSTFDLLNCSGWFRRLWTLQEIGLASEAMIHFGPASLEWDLLASFCTYLRNVMKGVRLVPPHPTPIIIVRRMLDFRDPNRSMLDVLRISSIQNCLDERDRVYALRGHTVFQNTLADASSKLYLPVDYGITHTKLYESVATRILQANEYSSLLLLNYASQNRDTILDLDISSWVPRWNYFMATPFTSGYWGKFATHGKMATDVSCCPRQLSVTGFTFDSIEWTSETFDYDHFPNDPAKAVDYANPHPFSQVWNYIRKAGGNQSRVLIEAMCLSMSTMLHSPKDECRFVSGAVTYAYFMGLDVSGLEHLADFGDMGYFLYKQECNRRRFFVTSNGWMGIGPAATQPGNDICIFFGAETPFVVWQLPSAGEHLYRLCGPCYVPGIMQGEAVKMLEAGEFEKTTFNLV